ncbi:MAG: HEAT repeat domain-containing protein [Bacteroidetes bacterium]|nr:HEAT repeat domain-containing protein [Bacteroidota bacterium]
MDDIEYLEKRWAELAGKPKSKEEIEEILRISEKIALLRAKEHQVLTEELSNIGIKITSIWDLVNTKDKYLMAIPVLLKHLTLDYSDKTKEGIIRALTVPEAKGIAMQVLLAEYLRLPKEKENLRWAIGNAVNVAITKHDAEDIFPIVLDKENGISRQMFVAALGKIKTENVKNVLHQLTHDHDEIIRNEAQKALKKW